LTLSALRSISKISVIKSETEKKLTNYLIDLLSIRTPSINEIVKNLSGGNRQKVMFGKIIATEPLIYLLDEPTKGIDISAKKDIMNFIKEELIKNSAVILTLPEIPGLMEISDKIYVLFKGEIVAKFKRDDFNEVAIYNATQGYAHNNIKRNTEGNIQ
jgi:ABC-type sugar transport system ATPase subunit